MKAGAAEFLTKPFRDEDLLEAIHQAIARDAIALEQRTELRELRIRHESLTPREREVMALVVQGLLNKQSGRRVGHERDYREDSARPGDAKNES